MKLYAILIILLLVGCTSTLNTYNSKDSNMELLETQDKFSLSSNYVDAGKDKAVILLHQLGSNKESYKEFQDSLKADKFSSLAIDLRGHGKSQGDYNDFSEQDFKNMIFDVAAAKNLLASKGIKNIYIVGASIGANTAINYGEKDPSIKAIVALSPGMSYQGIDTARNKIQPKLLIIASEQDSYSFESSQQLKDLLDAKIIERKGVEHGVAMLDLDTSIDIIEFLKDNP